MSDVFRNIPNQEKRTPCCIATNFIPAISVMVDAKDTDILLISSLLSVSHNTEVGVPNIIDGEQISTAVIDDSSGISSYLGENVTRLNPVVSVFNELLYKITKKTSTISNSIGANFKNGAYIENDASTLQILKFENKGSYGLAKMEDYIINSDVVQEEKNVWTAQAQKSSGTIGGITRLSGQINIQNIENNSSSCISEFRVNNETSKAFKFVSRDYPFASIRVEMFYKYDAFVVPKLFMSCDRKVKIISGQIQYLNYLKPGI